MSEGLKSRARGWPVARYGRSRGGRLRAPIADDGRAPPRRARAPYRVPRRRGRADRRQWSPRLHRERVPEIPAFPSWR